MSSLIPVSSSTSRAMLSGGATTSSYRAFAVELIREPLQKSQALAVDVRDSREVDDGEPRAFQFPVDPPMELVGVRKVDLAAQVHDDDAIQLLPL